MPPVKLAAFSAPAHGFGYGRADEVGAESLVYGVVYIDAIEFPVFRQSMFLPCVAPGAFGYIGLQSGFGSKLSEFHLSVVVRFPFSVCLICHRGQFVPMGKSIGSHSLAPLISIEGHAGEYCLPSRIAAYFDSAFGEKCEEYGMVFYFTVN